MTNDKDTKKAKRSPKSVVHMVPLEPYAVQFTDSEGYTRQYYAFKNPAGRFFLLDVTREDLMISEPINVPDFSKTEKLQKPVALGKPKIMNPPEWLEKAMNDWLESPPKEEEKDYGDDTSDTKSSAMKNALMGEEG